MSPGPTPALPCPRAARPGTRPPCSAGRYPALPFALQPGPEVRCLYVGAQEMLGATAEEARALVRVNTQLVRNSLAAPTAARKLEWWRSVVRRPPHDLLSAHNLLTC